MAVLRLTSAELVKRAGEYSLTNAAGRGFWPQSVYKPATPDGVGNVIGKVRCRESSTPVKMHSSPIFNRTSILDPHFVLFGPLQALRVRKPHRTDRAVRLRLGQATKQFLPPRETEWRVRTLEAGDTMRP